MFAKLRFNTLICVVAPLLIMCIDVLWSVMCVGVQLSVI